MSDKRDVLQAIYEMRVQGRSVSKLKHNLVKVCGTAIHLGRDAGYWDDLSHMRNLCRLVNVMLYSNAKGDSFHQDDLGKDFVSDVIGGNVEGLGGYDVTDTELMDELGDKFLDWRSYTISIPSDDTPSNEDISAFLKPKPPKRPKESSDASGLARLGRGSKPMPAPITDRKMLESMVDVSADDERYWVESVRLDRPMIPQPDTSVTELKFSTPFQSYVMYGESNVPFNQSQITAVTDVNRFSKQDLLRLYPKIRLYTRSPYMYKHYEGLDFDDDLGVIIKVKGFTKKQMLDNMIRYPHLDHLDRWVKVDDKDVTIPFWKHIEIDGEIHPTAEVWDKLPDTKKLPKTESFMREYVTRKYVLERDVKGIEHAYPMRGTLMPFLTLYAPSRYYSDKGFDVEDTARTCVEARRSFKESRNPIIHMHTTMGDEANVE